MADANSSLGSRYVLHDVLGHGAMGEVFRGSVRESQDSRHGGSLTGRD
jgi:hypothetical protein